MFGFLKNEWKLFIEDLNSVKGVFLKLFTKQDNYLMLDSSSNKAEESQATLNQQQVAKNVLNEQEQQAQQEPKLQVEELQTQVEAQLNQILADADQQEVQEVTENINLNIEAVQEVAENVDDAIQAVEEQAVSEVQEETLVQVEQAEEPAEQVSFKYEADGIDHKVTAYFGEEIDELKQNISGDKTQHEVLRNYAQFFKPYQEAQEMCNSAFRKYYDRHALKFATQELPIEQARIVQNNVDLFIKGQEIFGENNQFIDSRVDSIFEKVGINEVNKMVNILHDKADEQVNAQGERLFAEVVTYMVDNGIKVDKKASLLEPVKTVLEEKLNDVHSSLRSHEDWNDEYQALLSQERKYLYALNRIEQYETEQRISEFEEKINDLEAI